MMYYFNKLKSFLLRAARYGKFVTYQVGRRFLPASLKKLILRLFHYGERKIIAQHQELLKQILQSVQPGKDYRSIIVFPPSLQWDVQLFQRPQQLALALARQGALVFYLQSKPDRSKPPFQLISDRIYLCNVHVDVFQILPSPLIYLLTWNSDYASRFRSPRILYDFVDDVNVFYGDHQKIVKGHDYLLHNAAIVLATARKLVDEARVLRPDVIYSPNGVVYSHFAYITQESISPPADMLPVLAKSGPVIGYYGALARWFDYDLLKSVASLRPTYQFVLIGPDYDGTVEPADIFKISNIHCLGVKPYIDLPAYLHFFDVATIPFIVSDITHATSPLKLFEYMAGGKPVVITPMWESKQYEGVLVGGSPEEFAAQIDRALTLRHDPAYIEKIKRVAQQNTWESRAEDILQRIHTLPAA